MKSQISLFVLLLSLFPSALGALLAVDYGTEWTKASLVKPGIPLDVLLDKGECDALPVICETIGTCILILLSNPIDSKRKMQSVVGFKRDERVFGGEAVNAVRPFKTALTGTQLIGANLIVIGIGNPVSSRTLSLHQAAPSINRCSAIKHILYIPLATAIRFHHADAISASRFGSFLHLDCQRSFELHQVASRRNSGARTQLHQSTRFICRQGTHYRLVLDSPSLFHPTPEEGLQGCCRSRRSTLGR
jgi:hypothetical protein